MTADLEQGRRAGNAGEAEAEWQLFLQSGVLEILAAAVHELFLESLSTEERRSNPAAVPYEHLPDHLKEQNRDNVRDMANKLTLAGYSISQSLDDKYPVDFSDPLVDQMARQEHQRWMNVKLAKGWRYGTETVRAQKQHSSLVPWEALPESEKRKDSDLVRHIPRILAKAGCIIVKIETDTAES
ncbi:MAG: RyR domain-containing protein [Candidatus Promineifilaceae bacterium]